MQARLHFSRASWTLLDQGLVSLGAFLVNIQLARHLSAEQFGTFALLLGGFLGLQLVSSSLLLYPMSIRLPLLRGNERERLQATTVLLVASLCLPLCSALSVALAALGRADLIVPAVAVVLSWQLQELMRRGLLAEFRQHEAVYGDVASYFGQVGSLAGLIYFDHLTLTNALYCIAGSFAFGALVQAAQLRMTFRNIASPRATVLDFWSVGSWSLASNVVSLLRVQLLPWALAVSGGPAAAASFQAVLNVVNLTNPIILGLCNIIPQSVARARESGGNAAAWEAARVYMLIGVAARARLLLAGGALAFHSADRVLRSAVALHGVDSPCADPRACVERRVLHRHHLLLPARDEPRALGAQHQPVWRADGTRFRAAVD